MKKKEKSSKQKMQEIRRRQKRRHQAAVKKAKNQEKTLNRVEPFWVTFIHLTVNIIKEAGFKIDKKGRPFFSIKFNTEFQRPSHIVKTACIWRDTKGNYRILMNVSRLYYFKVYDDQKNLVNVLERTQHYSISFLMKNQKTVPVLIHQKVMIGFLPVDLDEMMNRIMDSALGLYIPVPSTEEPY
jgi:hypothetical protein